MIRLGAVEQSKLGRFSWILFQQDDLSYIFEKIEYIIFVITTNSAYILKIIIFTCKAKALRTNIWTIGPTDKPLDLQK